MLKKIGKHIRKYGQLYILIFPSIIYLLIFSYTPMYGIVMAFQNYKPKLGYFRSEWVGLEHFKRFLTYPGFGRLLANTLRISLYSLATFPLAIILALLFNELRSVGFKKTVQMITYAPHFLSTVVIGGLITMLVGREGPIGMIYQFVTGESVNLLTVPKFFDDIYVWSDVWQGIGWGSIIYIAALSGVSSDLIEAARIDGATRVQVIRYVNIPCIIPTIVTMFILRVGSVLNVGFEKIFLLQNDLNLDASRVISTYVYEIGLIGGQFSYSTAIGLFNTLVNVFMLLLTNWIVKKLSGTGL